MKDIKRSKGGLRQKTKNLLISTLEERKKISKCLRNERKTQRRRTDLCDMKKIKA